MAHDPTPVRAGLCYKHTFDEVRARALAQGWTTVDQIGEAMGCGTGCGLCRPYLELVLKTGCTAFAVQPDLRMEER